MAIGDVVQVSIEACDTRAPFARITGFDKSERPGTIRAIIIRLFTDDDVAARRPFPTGEYRTTAAFGIYPYQAEWP